MDFLPKRISLNILSVTRIRCIPAFLMSCLFLIGSEVCADDLFKSDDALSLTLSAPFKTIINERDKSKEYDANLVAESAQYAVKLQVRGNKRLDKNTCRYTQLRLNFDKKAIGKTLFAHQDDIKLVVQCKDGNRYADYLRTEFLAYKALSELTPNSYQVRWVEMTYIDTDDNAKARTEGAFFVERKSRLAKRLDLETTDVASVNVDQLDPKQAAIVNLFQYIVANPDFSIIAASPGEECCHNAKLLEKPDHTFLPVIYDFDSTGLVDASYAVPPSNLKIRRVTQRIYRGYCAHNDVTNEARNQILAAAQSMNDVFTKDTILSDKGKKKALRFLGRSIEELSDKESFAKRIIAECR